MVTCLRSGGGQWKYRNFVFVASFCCGRKSTQNGQCAIWRFLVQRQEYLMTLEKRNHVVLLRHLCPLYTLVLTSQVREHPLTVFTRISVTGSSRSGSIFPFHPSNVFQTEAKIACSSKCAIESCSYSSNQNITMPFA